MSMKIFTILLFLVSLAGCADTPENRAWANAIADGAREYNRLNNEQIKSMSQPVPVQQVPPLSQPTKCTTRYNSVFKQYETVCY